MCNKKQRQPKSLLIYENLGFGLLKAYITFENWVQILLKMLPIKTLLIPMNKCFSPHTNHTRWVAMMVLLYHLMVPLLDLRFDREMKIPHRQKSTLILQLLSSLLLLPSTALVSEPLKATKTSRHCDPIRKDLVSSWKRISARGRIKVSTW